MNIKINNIASMNMPASMDYTPDDRQTLIAVEGGNIVQDYGHVPSGDKLTINNIQFSRSDFEQIFSIWRNRTLVNFTDINNIVWQDVRIRILRYSYNQRFKNIINTDLEIWMI